MKVLHLRETGFSYSLILAVLCPVLHLTMQQFVQEHAVAPLMFRRFGEDVVKDIFYDSQFQFPRMIYN
ncbi:MAG: hypothetical protein IAB93_00625 [Bacteroidetes bacterium]|uniref:Uncharacterized protein n=1 Tax=Candidatus Merdivivens pullistercoris TaxID=2840873 RepID=A0A9D9I258_9BACT|nr:hypothetical protein [Candidatus Merdivivens pullistercoris]